MAVGPRRVSRRRDPGGRIAAMGDLGGEPATQTRDAEGLCLGRGLHRYSRLRGHDVREEVVLPLSEAVRRMTALPAAVLGLGDRGRLQTGVVAGLVVFDAATIIDQATFAEPHRTPRNIDTVLVNGTAVVRQGRVLRRGCVRAGQGRA